MDFITRPLGIILSFIYSFTNSYGFSIVLFTLFVKLILLPLAIKQQKSMVQTQKIQPIILDLQKKYKNDKEKLNQEMLKVYQEHKVNPASGCLPLLIQLPIIWGLYRVIYQPLTYILNLSADEIKKMATSLNLDYRQEIAIAEQMKNINLEFFGLNLALTPSLSRPDFLLLIPVLAALTTFLSSKLTSALSSNSTNQNDQAAQMQKSMMNIFPIMTGVITLSLPAGVGLYWVISNVFQIAQQIALNKYFAPTIKEGKA